MVEGLNQLRQRKARSSRNFPQTAEPCCFQPLFLEEISH